MKQLMMMLLSLAVAACAGGRGSEPPRSTGSPLLQAGTAPAADAEAGRPAAAPRQAEAAPQGEPAAERMDRIERKLEEINQKLDTVIARGAAAPPSARPPRVEPDRSKVYAVPIDGDPFEGKAAAKVTIVKAYDYACPYCEKNRATMDDLKQKYGKDLRIVYKQLIVHPRNATAAALGFCAAARQGKAFEMDRLLWEKGFNARQLDLTDVSLNAPGQGDSQTVKCWDHPEGCKIIDGFAAELRLDMGRFKADVKGDCQAQIANDGRHLAALSVSATPTFFINGRFMSGAQPLEQFTTLVDEELKKASERIAAGTPAAAYYKKWVLDQGLKSLTP
jgi:protein-disulfide isomerase